MSSHDSNPSRFDAALTQEWGRERSEEELAREDAQRAVMGLTPRTKPDDPAYRLLPDGHTSSTAVYDEDCSICCDPEYAQMGMSLCRECPDCKASERGLGHIPADDEECTVCGFNDREAYELKRDRQTMWLSMPCHEDPIGRRSIVVEKYAIAHSVLRWIDGAPFGVHHWAKTSVRYSWTN